MENSHIEKTIGEQVADLLKRKPENHDVAFSVGPDKIQIGAVRILLKAASPVFEKEFDENWESAVVTEEEGIPLLDVDPVVFEIFVKLIIADTWSQAQAALQKLNLAPDTLLSLLGLCRRFKITKAIKTLEAAVDDFVQDFYKFKDSLDFLEMSLENLETIFSCDQLPSDERGVFDSACRWAEHQCSEKKIEPTGENFREVLGSAFFQIRFPAMKHTFGKVSTFKKNLLTPDERLAIYDYLSMDEVDRANYDTTQLAFKTNPRNSLGCSVLRLSEFEQFKVTTDSFYVCDGSETSNDIQVDQKIALHGVGFLGPIDGDTQFEATLQIRRLVKGEWAFESLKFKKQIVARKDQIFHFLLDEPITIEPNAFDSSWSNRYYIYYSLKGTNNLPAYKVDGSYETYVQRSGVKFNLRYFHNTKPVTELLYKIQ